MSKATPGPWSVEDGTYLIWGECSFNDTGEIDRLGIPVAECHTAARSWGRRIEHDEIAANARLIAAAPGLLAALLDAQEELRLIRMKDTDAVYNPCLRVIMGLAIAKATGE